MPKSLFATFSSSDTFSQHIYGEFATHLPTVLEAVTTSLRLAVDTNSHSIDFRIEDSLCECLAGESDEAQPQAIDHGLFCFIDLCIKNAIIGVQEQNTFAQTERERRPTRRSAQASPGVAGFRLLSQRSGTAHWLQSKFGDALARYSTEGRSQGIVRTIFPRTTTEVGSAASTALGQPSSARADDARLSNESLDHRPHCGIDPESVRNPVPPRSRRTLDA